MTEEAWLACSDPTCMGPFIVRAASKRKARLLACACCRRLGHVLPDALRGYLDAAERYADRRSKKGELPIGLKGMGKRDYASQAVLEATYRHASVSSLLFTLIHVRLAVAENGLGDTGAELTTESAAQATVIRDIIGNPFRPVTADTSWLTSTTVGLARTIYEERAFDRLPILADALEEADCDEPAILDHCRSDGPHVRGCWAVDLVLGKE